MNPNKLKELSNKVFDEVANINGIWWSKVINHNILYQIRHELIAGLGDKRGK